MIINIMATSLLSMLVSVFVVAGLISWEGVKPKHFDKVVNHISAYSFASFIVLIGSIVAYIWWG